MWSRPDPSGDLATLHRLVAATALVMALLPAGDPAHRQARQLHAGFRAARDSLARPS